LLEDDEMTATVRVDRKGTINHWDAAAERLFGFTELEAIGNSIELIIPPQSHACHGRGFAMWKQARAICPRSLPRQAVTRTASPSA
jgi:PAS domain S-box-containing protein